MLLWFRFLDLDNVSTYVKKLFSLQANICGESDHFVFFFFLFTELTLTTMLNLCESQFVGILAEQLPVSYTSEQDDPLCWCRESYRFRSPNRDGWLLAGLQ